MPASPVRILPALPVVGLLVIWIAAVPANAAFPGRSGSIAYQKVFNGETAAEYAGGLIARPPRLGLPSRPLTEEPTDADPTYSADGRLIAFASKRHTAGERSGNHIFVMGADGGEIRQLTSGDGYLDSNPAFSPDGKLIAFERYDSSNPTTHIFTVRVGGGEVRQLIGGGSFAAEPTYSPNGRWIAFVSNRDPSRPGDPSNIFSMRPDGSHVRLLIGGRRREVDPDISPDGRRIAFASNRRHLGADVFVARVGRPHRPRPLTDSNGTCFEDRCYSDPSWSPDGRRIALRRRSRSTFAILVARADGRGGAEVLERGFYKEGCCDFIGPPAWGPSP